MKLTLNAQLLDASALPTAVVGRQGEPLDAAAGTHTAGQHVVGVQVVSTLMVQRGEAIFFFASIVIIF